MDATRMEHLAALQLEHGRYMKRLYAAFARKRWGKRWETLTEPQRAISIAAADRMCRSWAKDPALRDGYAAGVAEIVDLVAQQHHMNEQIAIIQQQNVRSNASVAAS